MGAAAERAGPPARPQAAAPRESTAARRSTLRRGLGFVTTTWILLRKAARLQALLLVVAGGCGASSPAPSASKGPPVPFATMTAQQKYDYMVSTVMPEMRALFVKFDPHRYPRMGCTPCHSRAPGTPDYRMPNEDLPLDPSKCEPGPGSDPREIEMNRFMTEDVGPAMGRLLGKPFDSCFWCHAYEL